MVKLIKEIKMIIILKNFSEQENKDKKMSLGKKLALIGGGTAGVLGLAAAGIYYHHQKEAEQLREQLKKTKNTAEDGLKKLNDKIREIEEEKAKVIAKLRTQKGWNSIERSENEVNKELEKLQKTKTEVADDITDRHKLLQEKLDKINNKDQIKNTKELDDFMLK
jgi:DNA repair exonuclease SbcCD ATPase subunit